MTGNDCRVNQTEEHVFKKPFSHVTVNFHQTQALASHLACNEPCHAGFFLACLLYVYFHHAPAQESSVCHSTTCIYS